MKFTVWMNDLLLSDGKWKPLYYKIRVIDAESPEAAMEWAQAQCEAFRALDRESAKKGTMRPEIALNTGYEVVKVVPGNKYLTIEKQAKKAVQNSWYAASMAEMHSEIS